LYEQHRVHHVGSFPQLEEQMTEYTPLTVDEQDSPDRMDALVWALWELSDPEEEVSIVTHEEQVSISPELDDLDTGPGFRIL
jgi:phage terminase large subunit-like protein